MQIKIKNDALMLSTDLDFKSGQFKLNLVTMDKQLLYLMYIPQFILGKKGMVDTALLPNSI